MKIKNAKKRNYVKGGRKLRQFRLGEEDYAVLQILSAKLGVTISDFIRDAIRTHTNQLYKKESP